MAIKIQGVEVVSDLRELTGVKFGSDEIAFPGAIGTENDVLIVGANNDLSFSTPPYSIVDANTFSLTSNLDVNGKTIFAANNENVSIQTGGSGQTILDSPVKTRTIDFGYDKTDGSVISKFMAAKATSSSTDAFAFATFDSTAVRSMKIIIQATQTSGANMYYYVSELLCFHNDIDAFYSEYATMDTTPNQDMVEVTSKLLNGNFIINITPGSADPIEYKFIMQQITA